MFRTIIGCLLSTGLPCTFVFVAVVGIALLSEPLFHEEE